MTIDELKKEQDCFVDWAKVLIQKNDDMNPIGFVLMYHGDIDKLREVGGHVEPVQPKYWFSGLKDHDIIAVARPFKMTWKEKFTVLYHAIPEDRREMLQALLQMGKDLEVDDEYMRVGRALMQVLKVGEKDVSALAMRQLCGASDAVAVITVMTAWMAEGAEVYKKYMASDSKSLDEFGESYEVLLVSLEAKAIQRNISIPIHRRPGKTRGTGKFKSWGKRAEVSSDVTPAFSYTGRFAEFLKPLQAKAST